LPQQCGQVTSASIALRPELNVHTRTVAGRPSRRPKWGQPRSTVSGRGEIARRSGIGQPAQFLQCAKDGARLLPLADNALELGADVEGGVNASNRCATRLCAAVYSRIVTLASETLLGQLGTRDPTLDEALGAAEGIGELCLGLAEPVLPKKLAVDVGLEDP
jgi:hypothetical protein